MKFIAILKDSLRETLDVKLFYVMVALSLITVLLVFSVTYKPVSVERQVTFGTDLWNLILRGQPNSDKLNLRTGIENFTRTDTHTEPWLGDYTFDFVIRWSVKVANLTPPEREAMKNVKEKFREALPPDTLQQAYSQLFRKVTVTEAKASEDQAEGEGAIVYHVVTSEGTKVKSRQEWVHEPSLFFGLVPIPVPLFPLSGILTFIGSWIIGAFGAAFTLLISIIITASFIPNMLSKGTIDLLLVKPIHRVTLFIDKFVGGLLFMFINTVVIMTGVWLAIGVQTGTWMNALLVCIFVYTFQFAVLYAVSALTAVLTRSTIVCILVTFMTWGILFTLGWAHWIFIENRRANAPPETKSHWAFVGFDTIYAMSPRYKDIDWLTSKMIEAELIQLRDEPPPAAGDKEEMAEHKRRQERAKETWKKQTEALDKRYGSYSWTSSLTVTSLFIVLVLGLACWRFAVKDY